MLASKPIVLTFGQLYGLIVARRPGMVPAIDGIGRLSVLDVVRRGSQLVTTAPRRAAPKGCCNREGAFKDDANHAAIRAGGMDFRGTRWVASELVNGHSHRITARYH
jgi:hypothetical protein